MSSVHDAEHIFETYLSLTTNVIASTGATIGVGETFTVRFTLDSKAEYGTYSHPTVIFQNMYMRVRATDYATILTSAVYNIYGHKFEFPQTELLPGHSTFVDVVFKAEKNMANEGFWPMLADMVSAEKVAEIYVFADFSAKEARLKLKEMHVEIDND